MHIFHFFPKYWNAKPFKNFPSVKFLNFGNVSSFSSFSCFSWGKKRGKIGKRLLDKNGQQSSSMYLCVYSSRELHIRGQNRQWRGVYGHVRTVVPVSKRQTEVPKASKRLLEYTVYLVHDARYMIRGVCSVAKKRYQVVGFHKFGYHKFERRTRSYTCVESNRYTEPIKMSTSSFFIIRTNAEELRPILCDKRSYINRWVHALR